MYGNDGMKNTYLVWCPDLGEIETHAGEYKNWEPEDAARAWALGQAIKNKKYGDHWEDLQNVVVKDLKTKTLTYWTVRPDWQPVYYISQNAQRHE